MLWLSLGENCLPGNIINRHNLRSFSTPYSDGRSNIDCALALEENNYEELLKPCNMMYVDAWGKRVVRSSLVFDGDDIFSKGHDNGFEFTYHNPIEIAADLDIYRNRVSRLNEIRGKEDVIFLYYHRTSNKSNMKELIKKLNKFSNYYASNSARCIVICFTQEITKNLSEKRIETASMDGATIHFKLITTQVWAGSDQDAFYARNDDDLILSFLNVTKDWLVADKPIPLSFRPDSSKLSEKIKKTSTGNEQIKNVYIEAKKLFDAKNYCSCIAVIDAALQQGFDDINLYKLHAESLFANNEFLKSLDSFQYCIKVLSTKCPYGLQVKANTAVDKTLNNAEKEIFYRICSDSVSLVFNDARKSLIQRDFLSSREYFMKGASTVFNNSDEKKLWIDAFEFMVIALQTGSVPNFDYSKKKTKKILVSGVGWSGSGAIYDFFSEFENVKAIRGESQLLEGVQGIINLVMKIGDSDGFVIAAIDFFFYAMLGYSEWKNSNTFKMFYFVRQRLESKRSLEYVLDVKVVSYLLSLCLIAHPKKFDLRFKEFTNESINRLAVDCDVAENEFALLDNVIHIWNVHLIEYFDDISIYCAFRDPRSNYVALLKENSGYVTSCDNFINEMKKKLPIFRKRVAAVDKNFDGASGRKIFVIQFEEFVLSALFRDELIARSGLDSAQQNKHSKFRPWESARNVMLHHEYEKPEEINKIAAALADYCYEPCIRPLSGLR